MESEPDQTVPGRRIRLLPLLVAGAGATVLGLAVTLLVRSFLALAVEAGGVCGIGEGGGIASDHCPKGVSTMLPLSAAAMLVFAPITVLSLVRSGAARRGAAAMVPMALIGAVCALPVFDRLHAEDLSVVWAAPADRPTGVESEGSWGPGSLVVRGRFDGLTAYDVAAGVRRSWIFGIREPQVLCAMSRTTGGGVGLIGQGGEDGPCTAMSAVDVTSGRALWTRPVRPVSPVVAVQPDVMTVAGDVAVARSGDEITAYALRAGDRRWTQRPAGGCRFRKVTGGGDQILADLVCEGGAPRIRAIDAGTGRTRWETAAPVGGASAKLTLLSASPAVVRVREGAPAGADVIAAFDPAGRVGAQIQVNDGKRTIEAGDGGFHAVPNRLVLVTGPSSGGTGGGTGTLIAAARRSDDSHLVLAYDLPGGRLRWTVEVPHGVRALRSDGRRLVLMDDALLSARLRSISLRGGELTEIGPIRHGTSSDMAIYLSGDRYVLVSESASAPYSHPVAVLRGG